MTTPGVTDSLVYKNFPLIAVTALAVLAKVGAVAVPIVLGPLALNTVITEVTLSKMNAFQISPNYIALALAATIIFTIASIITAFIFLPWPIAIIFTITSIVISVNNFNKINDALDITDGGYDVRYKAFVQLEDTELRKRIDTLILEADEKTRTDNAELFDKLIAYTKESSSIPKDFKDIDIRHQEIVSLNKALDKLTASA